MFRSLQWAADIQEADHTLVHFPFYFYKLFRQYINLVFMKRLMMGYLYPEECDNHISEESLGYKKIDMIYKTNSFCWLCN